MKLRPWTIARHQSVRAPEQTLAGDGDPAGTVARPDALLLQALDGADTRRLISAIPKEVFFLPRAVQPMPPGTRLFCRRVYCPGDRQLITITTDHRKSP